MRRSHIFIALILTCTFLISLFALPVSATAQSSSIDIHAINASYYNSTSGYTEMTYYDNTSTTAGTYVYNFPSTLDYNNISYSIRSCNVLGYPSGDIQLWQRGYIYTFSYEVRFRSASVPDVSLVTFDFGIASLGYDDALETEYISQFMSLGDVVIAQTTSSNYTTFIVSSTVYVDDSLNFGNIDPTNAALSLEISLYENTLSSIYIRVRDVKVIKSIGEESYYQASIDAITNIQNEIVNMSVNEYTWTYNFLDPTSKQEEITQIHGDVDDMLNQAKSNMTNFHDLLNSFDALEPMIYFGDWYIPFLGINIKGIPEVSGYFSGDYFYPLEVLNSMNPRITTWLNTFKMFVRLTFVVTMLSVTIYKMSRIEWWI